jgi:L-2-hydroxycarboxylate dehydrogenase (NAD+)
MGATMPESVLVDADALRRFTARAFEAARVPPEEARIAADVLVTADLRGVDSHGVARLHHYLARLARGLVAPTSSLTIVRERPAALTVDAGNGIGMVTARRTMELAIERAARYGSAAVAVRRGNHFGIAGYFAMMALPHDMIGVAMCNASPTVVPFGGRQPMLGTNPIAWAVPCGEEPALVMDMATSGVAYGKLEVAHRTGAAIPLGWALGANGAPTADPAEAMLARSILPLGGLAEGTGYKGYALATVVEALCHALSGAAMSRDIIAVQGRGELPSDIGHFFAVYAVDAFRPLAEFKAEMDGMLRALRSCPPQNEASPVLVPGEKEYRMSAQRARHGIPLHPSVVASLRAIATERGIEPVV